MKRWPIVVGAVLSGALLVVAGAAAYMNYQTAAQWRDRFSAAQDDVTALEEEVADRDAAIERVTDALEASEGDVEDLESRIAQFANEIARVEDEREWMTAHAERWAEVSFFYDEVASQFDSCVFEQSEFTQMIVDFDYYWFTNQVYLVEGQAFRADQVCGTAQSMLRDLRQYIDALAG